MPGGQAYGKELLGQLLIITMLHCTCSHLGTSELKAEKARVGCVCLIDVFCACLHVNLMTMWKHLLVHIRNTFSSRFPRN